MAVRFQWNVTPTDAAPKEKPYISAIHGRPPGATSRSLVSRQAWCSGAALDAQRPVFT